MKSIIIGIITLVAVVGGGYVATNEKTINALSPSQTPIFKNSVLVNIEDFIDVENNEDELESNIFNGESAIANA